MSVRYDANAHATPASWHVGTFSIFTCLVLLLTLALGGGTRPGLLSDVISQLVAIPLLLWGVLRVLQVEPAKRPNLALILVALPICVPLLQLIVLPLDLGQASVGMQLRREALALVGGATGSLSVAADVTLLSLLSMLPAVAVFIATLTLSVHERRLVVVVVIAFALLSVILGLAQLSQGQESALRFYAITNKEDAVGFFANRNHFSAFLNCALVLVSACLLFVASEAGLRSGFGPWRQVLLIAGVTLFVSLIAAQAMTRSRAGVGIALVALMLICAMTLGLLSPNDARSNPMRALGLAIGLGLALAIQYGTFRTVERFGSDPLQDARKDFAKNTFDAIVSFWPFGSGLGTFTQVYPAFERLETALVSTYVNRAHNDLVEYVLEGGVIAAAILAITVITLTMKAVPLWLRKPASIDLMLQRAAACVLVLILLHSIFDYPLRTASMLSLMAVSAALLLLNVPDPAPEAALPTERSKLKRKKSTHRASKPAPQQSAPEGEPASAVRPTRAKWGEEVDWPSAWKTNEKKDPQ